MADNTEMPDYPLDQLNRGIPPSQEIPESSVMDNVPTPTRLTPVRDLHSSQLYSPTNFSGTQDSGLPSISVLGKIKRTENKVKTLAERVNAIEGDSLHFHRSLSRLDEFKATAVDQARHLDTAVNHSKAGLEALSVTVGSHVGRDERDMETLRGMVERESAGRKIWQDSVFMELSDRVDYYFENLDLPVLERFQTVETTVEHLGDSVIKMRRQMTAMQRDLVRVKEDVGRLLQFVDLLKGGLPAL